MVMLWTVLVVLVGVANAKAAKRQDSEREIFLSLTGNGVDTGSISVSQCDEVGFTFGGGVPPYKFGIWAEDQQAVISEVSMDTGGKATWSIQSGLTNLSLILGDSAGGSVQSQPVLILSGTESCYDSTPVLRMGDQPGPSNTGPSNSVQGSLEDCRPNGSATCKFTTNGLSGIYSQQTLMGNIFANCNSNESVKQTFAGSTTITDNWSVGASATFGLPSNNIQVSTQISRGESRTVTQTFEWEIKPGKQTALIAIGNFNGLYGGMDLSYSNGTKSRITDAVYFKSTGEKATVTRSDINCGESWPPWNATTEANSSAIFQDSAAYLLGAVALILSVVALY